MDILAVIAGQLIGTSLSFEMWIAVVLVVFNARSAKHFFVTLAIAAVVLIGLRYAMIPNYRLPAMLAAAAALALWSSIGWGLRAMLTKRQPPAEAVPD